MNAAIRRKVHHFNLAGQAHELKFSCYRRLPLLSSDRTRGWVIESIEAARKKRGFAVLAYVIMPEHIHIIVYPSDQPYDIAWFLKSIKQPVSRKAHAWLLKHDQQWLKKLTLVRKDGQRVFRFWQAGGGYDRNIDRQATLRQMIEYLHNNPVRRGLVDRAVEWPWSSASWYERRECILEMDPLP